jgi:hypothetical protein
MSAALEVVFSSFWTFAGTLILVECVLEGVAAIIKAFRR